MDESLTIAGLTELSGMSSAVGEVAHPKPEPDLYLSAARTLGLPQIGCVAAEDSPTGIAAARAAGMAVFAVDRGYFPPEALSEAHVVAPLISMGGLAAA